MHWSNKTFLRPIINSHQRCKMNRSYFSTVSHCLSWWRNKSLTPIQVLETALNSLEQPWAALKSLEQPPGRKKMRGTLICWSPAAWCDLTHSTRLLNNALNKHQLSACIWDTQRERESEVLISITNLSRSEWVTLKGMWLVVVMNTSDWMESRRRRRRRRSGGRCFPAQEEAYWSSECVRWFELCSQWRRCNTEPSPLWEEVEDACERAGWWVFCSSRGFPSIPGSHVFLILKEEKNCGLRAGFNSLLTSQ